MRDTLCDTRGVVLEYLLRYCEKPKSVVRCSEPLAVSREHSSGGEFPQRVAGGVSVHTSETTNGVDTWIRVVTCGVRVVDESGCHGDYGGSVCIAVPAVVENLSVPPQDDGWTLGGLAFVCRHEIDPTCGSTSERSEATTTSRRPRVPGFDATETDASRPLRQRLSSVFLQSEVTWAASASEQVSCSRISAEVLVGRRDLVFVRRFGTLVLRKSFALGRRRFLCASSTHRVERCESLSVFRRCWECFVRRAWDSDYYRVYHLRDEFSDFPLSDDLTEVAEVLVANVEIRHCLFYVSVSEPPRNSHQVSAVAK